MTKLGKYTLLLFITIFMLILAYTTIAASIGVSPGTIHFKNVLRGGYSEKTVTITVASEKSVTVNVTTRGDTKDWLTFSEETFEVSKNKPHKLKIAVTPPNDVNNGNYEGSVRLLMEGFSELPEGSMASVVKAAVDLKIVTTVTDNEITGCRASSFMVRSAEKGDPVEFLVDVANDGNVRLRPHIIVDVYNQEETEMVKTADFDDEEILPTTKETILIRVPTDNLDISQYWAEMLVEECVASDMLTFDVLREGSLSATGVLKQVSNKVWAKVDETVPVVAVFQNTGKKPVSAVFKGKIQLDEKIIQTLESEELEVPVDETIDFEMFFMPKEAGKYVVSGRVFYENKRTFELSSIINVNSAEEGITEKQGGIKIKPLLIYTGMVIIIVLLFIKVRKEIKHRRT